MNLSLFASRGLDDIDHGSHRTVGSNASIDEIEARIRVADALQINSDAEALCYTHPDYDDQVVKWTKYTDCYEATDIYRYIFKHARESDDMFDNRVARGHYANYVASVVDLFVAYLFHSPITRTPGNFPTSDHTDFMTNCNLQGDTYHIFIQIMATFAQITGHCGVLVDVPQVLEEFENEHVRKAAGHRPYLVLLQASQIKDWKLDPFGNFDWVKIEVYPETNRGWKKMVDRVTRHFVIWKKDEWERWELEEDEARLVATGDNPLGEVPLVIVRNERCISHKWFGLSSVRDIADINIALLNWSSLADEEIYERCLNVLSMEKGVTDSAVELSHSNVLEYEPGSEKPEYLTPGTSPLDMIGDREKQAREEIYRLAKLGGSTGLMGVREATSGIAYAYEFNETNQSLAKKAESLEQAEKEIFRLVVGWFQIDWNGDVEYPREFGVEDFLTEFQILSEARMGLTSEDAIQRIEEKLALKLFAREDQNFRDRVVDQIRAADPRGPGLTETFSTLPAGLRGSGQTSGDNDSSSAE